MNNNIKDNKIIQKNLYYHNYTILSILDNNKEHSWKYDNVDTSSDEIIRFDNDHTLTLTHCRFDVKAKFGIENVIAVDFDEFFYCPKGGGIDCLILILSCSIIYINSIIYFKYT